jgi:hypothetical protein
MYPIFLLDLAIDRDGPKYTQLLSRFPRSLTEIFLNCIDASCGIPDVRTDSMTDARICIWISQVDTYKYHKLIIPFRF